MNLKLVLGFPFYDECENITYYRKFIRVHVCQKLLKLRFGKVIRKIICFFAHMVCDRLFISPCRWCARINIFLGTAFVMVQATYITYISVLLFLFCVESYVYYLICLLLQGIRSRCACTTCEPSQRILCCHRQQPEKRNRWSVSSVGKIISVCNHLPVLEVFKHCLNLNTKYVKKALVKSI